MSNGAPLHSAQGDINAFLLKEVSDIKECIGNIEGDIKIIKGFIGEKKQTAQTNDDRRFKVKSGIFLAAIGTIFGLIGAFTSKLFGN